MNTLKKLALIAVIAPMGVLGQSAIAAQDTSSPVRVVVPFSPGGQFDVVARQFAKFVTTKTGQPLVVDNVPGGGGNIGAARVAHADADGLTLLVMGGNHVAAQSIGGSLGYTLDQIAPIALFGASPHIIVASKNAPYNTFEEMLDYAKKNPEKMNYGTPGQGSTMHLTFEIIKDHYGFEATHIPYKGGGQAVTNLAGDQIDLAIVGVAPAIELVRAGKIKPLAVTSASRSKALPNVPALSELGFESLDGASWIGLAAPAGIKTDQKQYFVDLMNDFQSDESNFKDLEKRGFQTKELSLKELNYFIQSEKKNYDQVIKKFNIAM